jgi:hypothetical protein
MIVEEKVPVEHFHANCENSMKSVGGRSKCCFSLALYGFWSKGISLAKLIYINASMILNDENPSVLLDIKNHLTKGSTRCSSQSE